MKQKILSVVTAFLLGLTITSFTVNAENTLIDSGISYTETTETINNPGAGYTTTLWYTCKPNETPIKNPSGNIVLMFINIGAFSSGTNGVTDEDGNYTEGTDYDLDETFFAGLRGTLENCRQNGSTVALRFRYDENGKSNPEPSTFEQMEKHIRQIGENGVLEDYKDILMFVETGFVGAWGEQHSGKYTSLEDKAKLLDIMLDIVPKEVSVTVRTPNTFAKWAGIEMSEIDSFISEKGSNASRIGLYNDGYMGSDSDLGTYSNREKETTWLSNQTLTAYFGGEFSGNLDWAKKYDTYLPENSILEMYKTHLSYINGNIYNLYKDYTFDENYDVENVDNSAYYGQTVFKFIRDHLGYRFVLRDSDLSETVKQGETLKLDFDVENTGFANPVKKQKSEIILEKDGNYIVTEVDIDSCQWRSCTVNNEQLELKIPGGLEEGKWNVYIRFSIGNDSIKNGYKRTVRFANSDIWNGSLGANLLGEFTIEKTDDKELLTNNNFYQENTENSYKSNGTAYTVNNIVMLDGIRSGETEWTENQLKAQSGENKLYISNDDKNLYIMAEIVQKSDAPVYNLQIKNADENNKFYWIYYASNGFVYFNNGDYSGCECKRMGNFVEFKIPFGKIMNIQPKTLLSSVRVSIQDSANEWVNMGELTAENYTVSESFDVYSSCQSININENENYTMNVECYIDNPSYQWYFNNEIIENAKEKQYILSNATEKNIGVYSVKITSETGIVKMVDICNVKNVFSNGILGDANNDSKLNVRDCAFIASALANDKIDTISKNANFNKDDKINVRDAAAIANFLSKNK